MATFDEALAHVLATKDGAAVAINLWESDRGELVGAEVWSVTSERDDSGDYEPWDLHYEAGYFGSSGGEDAAFGPEDREVDLVRALAFDLITHDQFVHWLMTRPEYVLADLIGYKGDPEELPRDRAAVAVLRERFAVGVPTL